PCSRSRWWHSSWESTTSPHTQTPRKAVGILRTKKYCARCERTPFRAGPRSCLPKMPCLVTRYPVSDIVSPLSAQLPNRRHLPLGQTIASSNYLPFVAQCRRSTSKPSSENSLSYALPLSPRAASEPIVSPRPSADLTPTYQTTT